MQIKEGILLVLTVYKCTLRQRGKLYIYITPLKYESTLPLDAGP